MQDSPSTVWRNVIDIVVTREPNISEDLEKLNAHTENELYQLIKKYSYSYKSYFDFYNMIMW